MIDSAESKERDPRADNALKHGVYRYLETGELPEDLTGFDAALAGELLKMSGNSQRNAPIALLCARRLTVVELGWRNLLRFYDKAKERGTYAFPEILRILNSYMEGARRDLAEMGLTPASAQKIKSDDEPLTAAKVLEAVKGEDKHEQGT